MIIGTYLPIPTAVAIVMLIAGWFTGRPITLIARYQVLTAVCIVYISLMEITG